MKKQEYFYKTDYDSVDTNVIFSNPAIHYWDIFKKYKIDAIFLKDTLKELLLYFKEGNIYIRLTYSEQEQKLKYGICVDINDIIGSYKKDPHYTWYNTWNKFPIFIHVAEAYDWKNKDKDLIIRSSSMDGEIFYIAGDRDISWNNKTKEFKVRDLNHGIISPITKVVYTSVLVKEAIDRGRAITHEALCMLQEDNSYKMAFKFMFNNLKVPGPLTDSHDDHVLNSSVVFVDESIDIIIPESTLDSTRYMKFYGLNDLILHVARNHIPYNPDDPNSIFKNKVYPTRIWYTQGHSYAHMLINPNMKKKEEDSKE